MKTIALFLAFAACLASVFATDATRIVVVPKGMKPERKEISFCNSWARACRDEAKGHHLHVVSDVCHSWGFAPSAYYASHEARVDCIVENKKGKIFDFTERAVKHAKVTFAPADQS